MSIHQTKDGRWFAAFRLAGERNRQRREYFGRGHEAEIEARKWDHARKKGRLRPTSRGRDGMEFFALAALYLDQKPLAENTIYCIRHALNKHVRGMFHQTPIADLSMADLISLNQAMLDKGLALASRNRIRAYCRAICSWGVDNDLITANPFAKFRPDRKREGRAPDLITDDELRAIWSAAAPHLQWAIRCALNLGVRPGRSELFVIKMDDVDFQRRGIWVTRKKTHSRPEMIPVSLEFLAQIAEIKLGEPSRTHLVSYQGQPIKSLKTSWRNALARAGITRRIRLYDLRHKFATMLISGGADIKAASQLLGHSSVSTTLGIYHHVIDKQKRDAIKALDLPLPKHKQQ